MKPHGETLAQTLEEHDRNLHKMPEQLQTHGQDG